METVLPVTVTVSTVETVIGDVTPGRVVATIEISA